MQAIAHTFVRLENAIHRELVNHSAAFLRIAVGAIFLGFGLLKFFPGVSPAEDLAIATTDKLTFGLVPGSVALVGVAMLECFIGVCLLAGRWMRLAIWMLTLQFVGILAPLVVLPGRLFSGPYNAPTLEGQYVLKDVILVAAGMVIAAATFRGGRMVRDEPSPTPAGVAPPEDLGADAKLRIVLAGMQEGEPVAEVCARHGISEAVYYQWRDQLIGGATVALGDSVSSN